MTDLRIATATKITFVLLDSSGVEVTGLGGTLTVAVSKAGGAFAAGTGAKAEIGSGWYSYVLSALETNTAGQLAVTVSGAGTAQTNLLYDVVGFVASTTTGSDYCTLAQMKAVLRITSTDATDDDVIEDLITQASRLIDGETGRRFYTTAADETRYYTSKRGDCIFTDDIISITTFLLDLDGDRTYETTLATTDYDLMPQNAALDSQPYTWIETSPLGNYDFPTVRKGCSITGKFGYAASAPADITEATESIVVNFYHRRFGENTTGAATITAAGVVITPEDIPASAWKIIQRYKRIV